MGWEPTPEEFDRTLQPLWDFLTVRDEPVASDAIFVFGSPFEVVARQAADLFRKRFAPSVLITGHASGYAREFYNGKSEAEHFAFVMRTAGVPEQALHVEERARNTGENVSFGVSLLQERVRKVESLLLVAHPYHTRRCVATFTQAYPQIRVLSCPPNGGPFTFIRNRTPSEYGNRLLDELRRLREYPKLGYIAATEVPKPILEVGERVRSLIGG